MIFVYILAAILLIVLITRTFVVVPNDHICIIESKQQYFRPGLHILSPFASRRITPVEHRTGTSVETTITFNNSASYEYSIVASFKLWDPYTPFFTFEKLDEEMSKKAAEYFVQCGGKYSKQEFEQNIPSIKKEGLIVLNQFGAQYGIEFTDIAITPKTT